MSFVKIHSGQTNEIQWSPLSMLSLEMHPPWAHNSALLLYILGWGTFPDTLTSNQHLAWPKLLVWHCDKLTETLKTWKTNSHLPSHYPPHLGANSQLFQVPNCPRLELQDQIKFSRISQLEYFRGHQKHTFSEAELPQPSRDIDWLDLCLGVCATFCPGIK